MPWGVLDVAKGLAAVTLAAAALLGVSTSLILFMGRAAAETLALLITGVLELVMLLAALGFGGSSPGGTLRALGFRALRGWADLLLAAAVLVAGFVVSGTYASAVEWLGWKFLQPPPIPPIFAHGGVPFLAGGILALAIAPVAEEAFFRGFVFAGIAGRFGFWAGATVSAVAFALGHLVPGVMVPIFALGLLLAWLYHRTGSLWPSIIVHLSYNAFALVGTA